MMKDMWFSAMLSVAVSVDAEPSSISRTVIVFEADDEWESARQRALALGRTKEQTYKNGDGATVVHRLVAVETLDVLGERLADGREVYFESREATAGSLPSRSPEEIPPKQSGV
jgi:Domain of unknown function (DUF4288)